MCRRNCCYSSTATSGAHCTEKICDFSGIEGITRTKALRDALAAEGRTVSEKEFSEMMKPENCRFFRPVGGKRKPVKPQLFPNIGQNAAPPRDSSQVKRCRSCGAEISGRRIWCPACAYQRNLAWHREDRKRRAQASAAEKMGEVK